MVRKITRMDNGRNGRICRNANTHNQPRSTGGAGDRGGTSIIAVDKVIENLGSLSADQLLGVTQFLVVATNGGFINANNAIVLCRCIKRELTNRQITQGKEKSNDQDF